MGGSTSDKGQWWLPILGVSLVPRSSLFLRDIGLLSGETFFLLSVFLDFALMDRGRR